MATHVYHPIYRQCTQCGETISREQEQEECSADFVLTYPQEAKQIAERCCGLPEKDFASISGIDDVLQQLAEKVRLECRALIQKHAMSTWSGGLIERSDGITEVLVDFDLKWPRRS